LFTVLAGRGWWRRAPPGRSGYWGISPSANSCSWHRACWAAALHRRRAPRPRIHILYGALTALTLPVFYVITRGRDDNRAQWSYTFLLFLLTALSLRAVGTAAG
jgi:hypothetical protein